MKKSFLFMSLLLGLFVSVFALTACSSDDDDNDEGAPKTLAGTVWSSTNSDNYVITLEIKNSTDAHIKVISPSGKVTEETDGQYTYDSATGTGKFNMDDGTIVVGVFIGNTMTCTVDGEKLTFKRTK